MVEVGFLLQWFEAENTHVFEMSSYWNAQKGRRKQGVLL